MRLLLKPGTVIPQISDAEHWCWLGRVKIDDKIQKALCLILSRTLYVWSLKLGLL